MAATGLLLGSFLKIDYDGKAPEGLEGLFALDTYMWVFAAEKISHCATEYFLAASNGLIYRYRDTLRAIDLTELPYGAVFSSVDQKSLSPELIKAIKTVASEYIASHATSFEDDEVTVADPA